MLYIHVSLRYHRQLARITPETVSSFFSTLQESVKNNGGIEYTSSQTTIYCFDEKSVGFAFATSRVIGDLQHILDHERERIREYFILVDRIPDTDSCEQAIDAAGKFLCTPLPDEGVLISEGAVQLLDSYINTVSITGTLLRACTGSKLIPYSTDGSDKSDTAGDFFCLFPTDPDDMISPLIDFLDQSRFPQPESPSRQAIRMFQSNRFSPTQPEFRLVACYEYISHCFDNWSKLNERLPLLRLYGPHASREMQGHLEKFLGGSCRFEIDNNPVRYMPTDFKNIPRDLLELAYLSYRCVQFLYASEYESFFASIGKKGAFIQSLGSWLYSFGFLSDPSDYRSLNPDIYMKLAELLGFRCAELDKLLARWLWNSYMNGILQAGFPLMEILDKLGFSVPDSFMVNCIYHAPNPQEAVKSLNRPFSSAKVAHAVRESNRSWNLYERGLFSEAALVSKECLHTFQKEHIAAGEHRTFSLISRLSLALGKGADAAVYLEYAYESAEKLHDNDFTLQTKFDMAMVHFLNGNLPIAATLLDTVEKMIEACYAKDWEIVCLFMKGRTSFEMGDYRNAALIFNTATTYASVHQLSGSICLSRTWYARTLSHMGNYQEAADILAQCTQQIPDAWLFLVEAGILSQKKLGGLEFPDSLDTMFTTSQLPEGDKISWITGFECAEDRAYCSVPVTRTATKMYSVFIIAYRTLCASSRPDPSVFISMTELARSATERSDPWAATYWYLWYSIGRRWNFIEAAEGEAALSRGFKLLQKRTNAIPDTVEREAFMQNPVWNRKLFLTARDNKLI